MPRGCITECWDVKYFNRICDCLNAVRLNLLTSPVFVDDDGADLLLDRLCQYSSFVDCDCIRISLFVSDMLLLREFIGWSFGSGFIYESYDVCVDWSKLVEDRCRLFAIAEQERRDLKRKQCENARKVILEKRNVRSQRDKQLYQDIVSYVEKCEKLGIKPVKRYLKRKGYCDSEIYRVWRKFDMDCELQVS